MSDTPEIITYNYDAEYASQVITEIPLGYVDKTICGCGLTTVALENTIPTIIAVPSVLLVENKEAQYPNSRFSGKILGVTSKVSKSDIYEYIKHEPIPKIMVTYDSLWKVQFLLENPAYRLIIDESDKLLSFTSLKLQDKESTQDIDVLTSLFNIAKKYKSVTSFISATPIPLKYMPSWISELPQVKMTWKNTIKSTPYIMERGHPFRSLRDEILIPLKSSNSVTIANMEFKKAIIFINSVENILKVIRESELDHSEVCVIAGDSLRNDMRLSEFNKLTDPSNLHKYTFITSTGFQGIDLYDSEAVSIVVSYTGRKYTMIDISTDLKQAVSRQRVKTNTNYGKYIYIYNQSAFAKTEEELLESIDQLESSIREAIDLHELAKTNSKVNGFDILAKDSNDFKYYTTYNNQTDSYELNELSFNSDKYFLLETKKQYTKGFDIQSSFENAETIPPVKVKSLKEVTFSDLVRHFNEEIAENPITPEQLASTNQEFLINWGRNSGKIKWIQAIETCYRLYGRVVSKYDRVKQLISNYNMFSNQLYLDILELFHVNKSYSRAEVKTTLNRLYCTHNIKRNAKHSDLGEIFKVRDKTIQGTRYVEILGYLKEDREIDELEM